MENECYNCDKEYLLNSCEKFFNSKICQECRTKDFHFNSIITEDKSLWIKKPEISKQWVIELNTFKRKNNSLIKILPIDISFKSRRECFFYCDGCQNITKASLNNASRSEKIFCYTCSRVNTGKSNSIPKNYSVYDDKELLRLWSFEKNETHPSKVALQSNKNYYWICEKRHITLTSPASRSRGRRCKICMEKYFVSEPERQLRDFIESFYNGKIEFNKKNYIHPYELDIVLPEIKVAIEFNGVYFHSDKKILEKHGISSFEYHSRKLDLAAEVSLDLLFIWEDDWYNNKEQVMKILRNRVLHGIPSRALKRLEV